MSMYWCYRCYARNPSPLGRCQRCGGAIAAPADLSFDERLVWTLSHPDGDRAMVAARLLGERRVQAAAPALQTVAESGPDPFVAARALESLIEILDPAAVRPLLLRLADDPRFLVARVARRGLGPSAPATAHRPTIHRGR